MIEKLSPMLRRRLVAGRCIAIREGASSALAYLKTILETAGTSFSPLESVAIGQLMSEIAFLDNQYDQAKELFESCVESYFDKLDEETRFRCRQNRAYFGSQMFDVKMGSEWDRLVDEREFVGVKVDNAETWEMVHAARKAGRLHESLPMVWRMQIEGYRSGLWYRRVKAEVEFAEECLLLGLLGEATLHAFAGNGHDIIDRIGERLTTQSSPTVVRDAVLKSCAAAGLAKHAAICAMLIKSVGDSVPEDAIPAVFGWLMSGTKIVPRNAFDVARYVAIWEALAAIAPLLASLQVAECIDRATELAVWKAPQPYRETIIKCVRQFVPRLSKRSASSLLVKCSHLVKSTRSPFDEGHAFSLIHSLAKMSNVKSKIKVAEEVYASGTKVDPFLFSLAPSLGRDFASEDSLRGNVDNVVKILRQVVQRLPKDVTPSAIYGSYYFITAELPSENVVVQCMSNTVVAFLIPVRTKIPSDSLVEVIKVIVDLLRERENIITNRILMVSWLMGFMDCIKPETMAPALDIVIRWAEGNIDEPTVTMTASEAENPLNPFKLGSGNPSELRGVSLQFIARALQHFPEIISQRIESVIEDSTTDPSGKIRAWGIDACKSLPKLNQTLRGAIVLGLRDEDRDVLINCLRVISAKQFRIRSHDVGAIAYGIAMAAKSTDKTIRALAGKAAVLLLRRKLPPQPKSRLEHVVANLRDDLSHRVRYSVSSAKHSELISS